MEFAQFLNSITNEFLSCANYRLDDERAMIADLFIESAREIPYVPDTNLWEKFCTVAYAQDLEEVLDDVRDAVTYANTGFLQEEDALRIRRKYFIK